MLQFKHRQSGGLSLRIICANSVNQNDGAVLARHDLHAGIIYPHILHAQADPSAANTVRPIGPTKSLKISGSEKDTNIFPAIYRFTDNTDGLDDAKLFQQIVFQKLLLKRWDIVTVISSAYSDHPKKWQTLRIWKNPSGGPLVLMVYGKLVDKCDPFFLCETQEHFPKATSTGSQKAKVSTADKKEEKLTLMPKRRGSKESTFSSDLGESRAVVAVAEKIQSLEFQFHNGNHKDEFLKLWNSEGG